MGQSLTSEFFTSVVGHVTLQGDSEGQSSNLCGMTTFIDLIVYIVRDPEVIFPEMKTIRVSVIRESSVEEFKG